MYNGVRTSVNVLLNCLGYWDMEERDIGNAEGWPVSNNGDDVFFVAVSAAG